MESSAQSSINFLRKLTDLAERVAHHGLVIDHFRSDYGSFGSFVLDVARGRVGIRFTWDGRDNHLTVETAKKPPLSGATGFQSVLEERFESLDSVCRFIEEQLEQALRDGWHE